MEEQRNTKTSNTKVQLFQKLALSDPDFLFLFNSSSRQVEVLDPNETPFLTDTIQERPSFPLNFLKVIRPQERKRFFDRLNTFEPKDRENYEEMELKIPDGQEKFKCFNLRFTPGLVQENGHIETWLFRARDISNRRELEKQSKQLKMALEGSNMGIWSFDPISQKIECDSRTAFIFGFTEKKIPADVKQFILKIHPEDRELAIITALRTLKKEGGFNHEFRIIPGGSMVTRTIALIGNFISDEQDKVSKISGVCLDISNYPIAGNRIKTNEAFLEESQRIANLGCYDWDLELDKISLTRQLYKILEVTDYDKFSLQYFLDRIYPADSSAFENTLKKAIKNGAEFNKEFRYITPSGKTKILWAKGKTNRNLQKRTSRIIGTIQDITEKKEKENELNTQNLIIRSILDNLPVIILIVNKKGIVKTLLGSGLKRIGLNENEIVGQNIFEQYPPIAKHIFKVLNGETVHFTEELKVRDEKIHFLSYYFYDHERELAIGFSIDVTAQKNAEAAFLQVSAKNQELERMNQVMDMFVYAVAHDLKNPINNLAMLSSLIKEAENKSEEEEYLAALEKSVFRLKQTISGLTDIIEIESSRDLHSRKLSFKAVFEHVMADLAPLLKEKSGIVNTRFDTSYISYNEAFLISILKNLISNAIKYGAQNRPIEIFVSTEQKDGFVVLQVKDNGIGINLEQVGRYLFKPFKRFTQQAEGTGVGLHLIKSMVERNGGLIKVESIPGKGSTFTCYLNPY